MKKHEENRIAYIIFQALYFGIILGCICYLSDLLFLDAAFFPSGLEEYSIGAVMNLPVKQLMFYVLKCRMTQLIFLILGTIVISYGTAVGTFGLLFGWLYGMAMCNLLVQYGIKGTVYGLFCFLPHYLFYFSAMYLWGKWFCGTGQYEKYYDWNVKIIQYLFKFFVIFFLIVLSLMWEIKFQKNILKIFYQYLV